MNHYVYFLRTRLKDLLMRLGLLGAARWFWYLIKLLVKPEYRLQVSELRRRERAQRQRFLEFKQQYANVLRYRLISGDYGQRSALVVSTNFPEIEAELGLVKGLELAGFAPRVVVPGHFKLVPKYYSLASINEVSFLSEFTPSSNHAAAEAAIETCKSMQELLAIEYAGVRVGRIAVATALRHQRLASLDLESPQDRQMIVEYVASSMAATTAAQRVLRQSRPDLTMLWDPVYTPQGELFESCLRKGIDVIVWSPAHRSNTLIFKRYSLEIIGEHYASLSSESWRLLCDIEWTNSHRERLQQELSDTYASGDWYPSAGNQFSSRFVDADEIQRLIGLDPTKKTAIIFPHIFWDATLTSGSDLFRSYESWFIETIRVAITNAQVNWVIKIHPAHVGKGMREGFRGEPAEVGVLRKHIGNLPSHIFMIPADSDISTFSLFKLMDYCITVRGTIGIEAARLGIPVLTAGTGRYDRRGFTIDSDSCEEYIDRLTLIQKIPRLSPTRRELAERFAYGLFVLRPLPLTTVSLGYHKDYGAEIEYARTQINITRPEGWYSAPDLRAFAQWVADSNNPDFLMPLPEKQDSDQH